MAEGFVSIDERIAILRRRRGMSQAVLAVRLGLSEQWLWNIDRGRIEDGRYPVPLSTQEDAGKVLVAKVREWLEHLSGKPRARSTSPLVRSYEPVPLWAER